MTTTQVSIEPLEADGPAPGGSNRDLQAVIDATPALIWWAGPDGKTEDANQYFLDYVGLGREEIQRSGWTAAIHPDDREGIAGVWRALRAAGEAGEGEVRLRRHDGDYRWFLVRANPLRDETGAIIGWCGVNTDIEDRKTAELALAIRERSLTEAIDRFPANLSFVTGAGADVSLSQHFWDFTGMAPDPDQPVAWLNAYHPEDRDRMLAKFSSFRLAGEGGVVEGRLRRQDGIYRWFQIRTRPFRDESGHIVRWYTVGIDIEDLKAAEEARDKARSELAYAARAMSLGVLTASIAHEVNQPLSGILTNASTGLRMLSIDVPNVEGARETALRTIRDAKRASEVIARLRTLFARREIACEAVDLGEAAREVLALSGHELRRNRIELRTEFAEGLPSVPGDRVQLQQVMLNLILNAADAMKGIDPGARLMIVETAPDAVGVRFSVRDSGVGINPEQVARLFDAFYTTKAEGMGIGLSVSRSIVEQHGGRLSASQNDGPGATFAFSVPFTSEPEAPS